MALPPHPSRRSKLAAPARVIRSRRDTSPPASGARALRAISEPRLSLHSVDLEETLVHPPEDDPLDLVVAALRGVSCLRAVEAASVCVAASVRAIGCRAAIAHLWDAREECFVIAYALGPNAGVLLNARHGREDPILTQSFRKRVPRVMNQSHAARPTLARYSALGGAWSVLVAPVIDGERPLGAIELVDPLDGSCFDDRHIAAASYTTDRLVALLRGVDTSIGTLIAPPEDWADG
jgi:hypothetical protein